MNSARVAGVLLLTFAVLGAGRAESPAGVTFHVAPNGNDSWSGKLAAPNADRTDGPFATPTHARDAARKRRTGKPRAGPVTVLLRTGRNRACARLARAQLT